MPFVIVNSGAHPPHLVPAADFADCDAVCSTGVSWERTIFAIPNPPCFAIACASASEAKLPMVPMLPLLGPSLPRLSPPSPLPLPNSGSSRIGFNSSPKKLASNELAALISCGLAVACCGPATDARRESDIFISTSPPDRLRATLPASSPEGWKLHRWRWPQSTAGCALNRPRSHLLSTRSDSPEDCSPEPASAAPPVLYRSQMGWAAKPQNATRY